MIAIYLSEEDTTPVGIFLKEVDAFNTQVEVSSPSKFAKETVSNRIFASLSKTDEELKKEGEDNAKKEAWDKGPDK
jgi:hypothetical protein